MPGLSSLGRVAELSRVDPLLVPLVLALLPWTPLLAVLPPLLGLDIFSGPWRGLSPLGGDGVGWSWRMWYNCAPACVHGPPGGARCGTFSLDVAVAGVTELDIRKRHRSARCRCWLTLLTSRGTRTLCLIPSRLAWGLRRRLVRLTRMVTMRLYGRCTRPRARVRLRMSRVRRIG